MREDIRMKQMEAAFQRENEQWDRLKPIRDHFDGKNRFVLDVYEIGDEYQIVKYESRFNGENEILFQPFLKYKRIAVSTYTLDAALLTAIAYKNDNQNTNSAIYACRLLNVKDEPEQ